MNLRFWKRTSDSDGLPGRTGLWLAGILALATALRLINIGKEPFWCDEILSLDIATSFDSASEMLRYLAQVEFHPPLYYLIIRPWVGIFGASEVSLRSLSLIFSLGIVFMVYVIARRMFNDRRIGLLAAGITAVLPLQIEFGQEARPYAMFCFAGCLAVFAVWEHLRSGRRSWLVLYAAASAIGLYLHYSYLFIAVATALWWFAESTPGGKDRRRRMMDWLMAHAAVFVLFWPWMDDLLYKILLGRFDIFGFERNLVSSRAPNFFGNLLDSVIWVTKDNYVPVVQNLAVALAIGVFVWVAVKMVSGGAGERGSGRTFGALVSLAAIPAALFLVAPYSIPYSAIIERHVIWITVPIAIVISAVAVRAGMKRGAVLIAVFIASLLPYIVGIAVDDSLYDSYFRLQEGAEYINEQYKDGDIVIVPISILRSDFAHYLREDVPIEVLTPVQYRSHDIWRGRHVLGLIENEVQVRIPKTSRTEVFDKFDWIVDKYDPQRVWIYGARGDDYKIHDWFDDGVWRHGFRSIGGVLQLDLYSKR